MSCPVVEGELSYLALQGSKSGNPGLPVTDSQKRQEAQRKEQEKERAAAMVAGTARPEAKRGLSSVWRST
eukprot:7224888-Prorocentrum_lima.AAC.1